MGTPGTLPPITCMVGDFMEIQYQNIGVFKSKWGSFAKMATPDVDFFALTAQLLDPDS